MDKLLTTLGIAFIGAALYMWGWHFGGGLGVMIAGCYCFTSHWDIDFKISKSSEEKEYIK